MINYLKTAFNIDTTYSINSVIYNLKRIPILGVFLPNNMYSNIFFKKILCFIIIIYTLLKSIVFKLFYLFIIYLISSLFKNQVNFFIYIFIIFTMMGIVFNSKIVGVSTKKYFSINLFSMNANIYTKANLIMEGILNFIFTFLGLLVFGYLLKIDILFVFLLTIFNTCLKYVSEYTNLKFYLKYKYRIVDENYYLLYIVLLTCLLFLPLLNININLISLSIITFISIILFIISINKLFKYDNYKLVYKRINTFTMVMNSDTSKAYSKQNTIIIKDKDKYINNDKIKDKRGYDLFNTIFFERHKDVLLRSSIIYSLVALGVIILIILFILFKPIYNNEISNYFNNNIGVFVFIMYFINRGMTVTRAMFYNCDHSMLTFNFYRESSVILNVFKKRLLMLIKINLIPAIVIGIGSSLIMYLVDGFSFNLMTICLFIIILSIFFSIHYLVLYYLMQPFDSDMKINNYSYNIVCFITYFIAYTLLNLKMSSFMFSIYGIIFTICYIIISLFLVYRFAPKTFKIK